MRVRVPSALLFSEGGFTVVSDRGPVLKTGDAWRRGFDSLALRQTLLMAK